MYRIIYPNNSSISIIIPSVDRDLNILGKSLVPMGKPFKIINADLIPSDRTFRNAWEYDFTNPDGYGENNDNY